MRILVVDDDVSVRMAMQIELDDVEVLEASRAAEVAGQLGSGPLDAVIVDQRLPDAKGIEVVQLLRSSAATADLPIIVASSALDTDLREAAFTAGADELVLKPYEAAAVVHIVRRLHALTAGERAKRRVLHRARLHSGRDDGGLLDLPEVEAGAPRGNEPRRRRWRPFRH